MTSAVSKRVSTKAEKSREFSGKTKNTRRHTGEQLKETKGSHRHDSSKGKQRPSKDAEHSSARKSSRSQTRHERQRPSEYQGRRYSHHSRGKSRHHGNHSEFSGADYVDNMTSAVVSKTTIHSHDYIPRATDIAMAAMSLIGTPYRYGGNSPLTGLDCSGFVKYVYKEAMDADLPRTAAEMSKVGKPVSQDDLQPGDLVFYNTMRRNNSHVGIYLGDGRFIHSPRTGQRIRISNMDENYWRGRFNGARRVIEGKGIDRVKALQRYSREADTSPDTYDYDADDEFRVQQFSKRASNEVTEQTLADTRKSTDDILVKEKTAKETQFDNDKEVLHERSNQNRQHQEQEARPQDNTVKEIVGDSDSKRHKGAKHNGKEEIHHKTPRRSNAGGHPQSRKGVHYRGKGGGTGYGKNQKFPL